MANRPRKPTRETSGEPIRIVPIRVTDTERIEYQKAAERSGLSLSEWARTELKIGPRSASRRRGSETA